MTKAAEWATRLEAWRASGEKADEFLRGARLLGEESGVVVELPSPEGDVLAEEARGDNAGTLVRKPICGGDSIV
jgi:hypothetical protein